MKARVNWPIFTQTNLDSGELTMLGSVIHNFSEPGEYLGTVLLRDETVGRFNLTVEEGCPTVQANIDLATLHKPEPAQCKDEPQKRYVVNPKGYAVFYVSKGTGGYSVVVGKIQNKGESKLAFNSRELGEGDMFAVTMIRPGIYSVLNEKNDAKAEITVRYPKIGKVPYRPPTPVTINCTGKRLTPNKIDIQPAQGQVYKIQTPSRIKIELIRPIDGSSEEKQPRTRKTKKQK